MILTNTNETEKEDKTTVNKRIYGISLSRLK